MGPQRRELPAQELWQLLPYGNYGTETIGGWDERFGFRAVRGRFLENRDGGIFGGKGLN